LLIIYNNLLNNSNQQLQGNTVISLKGDMLLVGGRQERV